MTGPHYRLNYPSALWLRVLLKKHNMNSDTVATNRSSSLLVTQNGKQTMDSIQRMAFGASERIWTQLESEIELNSDTATEVAGGIIKQYLIGGILYGTIREIEMARFVVDEMKPDCVWVQRTGFSALVGNAFEIVSREYKIKTRIVEPRILSIMRNYVGRNETLRYLGNHLFSERLLLEGGMDTSRHDRRVFFDVPYWNWFISVKPVIEHLLQGSDIVFVLTDGHVPEGLRPLGLKTRSEEESDITKEVRRTLQNYRSRRSTKRFQSIFEWKGMNLWELVADQVDFAFEILLPLMPNHVAFCRSVLDTVEPDISVIATAPRSYALGNMAVLCKLRGIPLLEVQHGLFNPLHDPFVQPLLFDRIACGGPHWRRKFVERGATLDAIVVTGWPNYDEYTNVDTGGTNAEARTILYLGQGELSESGIRVLKRISSLLDETGATLLIKPHPVEDARQYSLKLPKHSRIGVLEPRAKLRDCLGRSDVVITYDSTGGIEAVLLGKRLLCLNLDHVGSAFRDMYVESGVAEEIVNLDQLEEWIRNMNEMETAKDLRLARSKFISDMVYLVDGKASSRIVDLIHEMIRVAPNSNGRVGPNR